ncbi:lipopolysaccharide/colanic/teichoic acid biosynthesis glycosyltransferase [Limimaricola soesokkakensis]|uniref:Lipopolysaccharide/colanic/teichoic acid biosynthesis glycosyltransferase n=1 Tax=Limimaricola soesokkakensis TaxID=1343159 RepID=A0A1X6ZYL7_9RHOB|nr:sugar transferase [Limimaricola soesokkakensis]PSK82498.1 lipopolysaccharide/colanic/teichoic acid biosynthesis glycosyltransferase [Limimaricola soesokkakensis]SLN65346.1 Undecaprenyl phosphate N,N'-diacetylbacillosamine 1-phosphate transferase [Limimaricola soesokkakensis]
MGYNRFAKRLLDLVLVAILLVPLLPVIGTLYLLVRREGGPGFFGHERVGRNGVTFKCWKIRTMVPDAEARLAALLASDPEARAEWERDHKLRDDPRVTRLGALLRKTSLDELPQIWNVLKGEMSLIGPRPVTEAELSRYGHQSWVYLSLRPGVTGLWQVSGRNDIAYDERVALDARYLERLSMPLDLKILIQTVGAVLNRTGC